MKGACLKVYRYRSAVTGRWVSEAYAKRYPHLTVRERVTSDGFNQFCKDSATVPLRPQA